MKKTSFTTEQIIAILQEHAAGEQAAELIRRHCISLANGSEVRSRAFDAWAADRHIERLCIQQRKPIQNAHIESFNGRLRDACLNQHWFLSLRDAQFHIARWRRSYNTDRPHESCFPLTPHEYAATFPSPNARLSA
jgi:putative transposase